MDLQSHWLSASERVGPGHIVSIIIPSCALEAGCWSPWRLRRAVSIGLSAKKVTSWQVLLWNGATDKAVRNEKDLQGSASSFDNSDVLP